MLHTLALVFASGNGWHHHHWWIVFPLFWLLVAATALAFFWRRPRGSGGNGGDSPQRILAERFARGEITGDEYRDRLAQLQ